MTLLERDREKIEEGREEGREEGIKELILKQYNKGLSIEYIADINEIDVEYVRDVVKNSTPKSWIIKKICIEKALTNYWDIYGKG